MGLMRYPENYEGFECWSVRYPTTKKEWGRYLLGLRDLENLLDMNAEGLSGIICYNYPALAQWRLFSKCKELSGKCIADITEWHEAGAGSVMLRLVRSIDIWLRMSIVNFRADGIIAISPMLARLYLTRGLPVVEIPTLFDTQTLAQPPIADAAARRFIYVGNPFTDGRVNRERSNVKDRLDVCIKLFQRLAVDGHEFVFDIYGVERKQYLNVFPDDEDFLCSEQKRICFHGRVDNAMARRFVAESDFSIFVREPSRVILAGFPTKLAESISVGTPVITNNHENLRGYAEIPGLYLVEREREYDCLLDVMRLAEDEVRRLKQLAFQSRAFDFRSYVADMALFLESMR